MKRLRERVLEDDDVHTFCKNIITEGLTKDPVDAYYDCELALEVLKERMNEVNNTERIGSEG